MQILFLILLFLIPVILSIGSIILGDKDYVYAPTWVVLAGITFVISCISCVSFIL